MMANETKYGKRKGKLSGFRKWISTIASAQINVFPIPGEEVFRSNGIHLPHLGYEIAANPRQANLMLLAAPINEQLAKKAAVAYVQMPRPRVLVFVNSGQVKHLPTPDFQVEMQENDFIQLKNKIKDYLSNPYQSESEALEIPFIKEMLEEQENQSQGHEHHHHNHGGDHQHEEGCEHEQDEHENHHQEHCQKNEEQNHPEGDEHQQEQHSEEEQDQHKEHDSKEGEKQHEHYDHQEHEGHGGHEHEHGGHGGGGFMSMVMMTKDMPRAMDDLPMEHNQVWFGPFFPGFTGGLAFQMMLDGDTVMKVQTDNDLWKRNWDELCGMPAKDLPEKLAAMNPLAPQSYRLLAEVALAKIGNHEQLLTYPQILALEKERICSHLNWLVTLGRLAGNQWIYNSAGQALADYQKDRNIKQVSNLVNKVLNFKYLRKKLMVGTIPESLLHHTSGSVARAANVVKDLRVQDKNYGELGFETIALDENNAWGRLNIRLLEIKQSLELIQRIESKQLAKAREPSPLSSDGSASFVLEAPHGANSISLVIKQDKVEQLQLQSVANINLSIATQAVSHLELSDALLTIHSLDINPYEITVE